VFALAACIAVALGVILGTGWSRPVPKPAGPKVATRSLPPPALVWIDPSSGAVVSRVVGDVSPAFRGAVSPDGSRVAFVRVVKGHEQLFVTNGSGGFTRLTGQGKGGCACGSFDPAWSPDGREIAFAGIDLFGNQDIYVVNIDSGAIRRVTHDPSLDATPAWSPTDGRSRSPAVSSRTPRSGSWTCRTVTCGS
jgi:hypothetical protein